MSNQDNPVVRSVITMSLCATIGIYLGYRVGTECPKVITDTLNSFNPTVNSPNKYGNLIDTTTADPNSSILSVKSIQLRALFVIRREHMLVFKLSSGESISLTLLTSGDVTLSDFNLVENDFDDDEISTQNWNGFEHRPLSDLKQYLQTKNAFVRLCKYNLVLRFSGVFVREVHADFYSPLAPLINNEDSAPLLAAITTGNNNKDNVITGDAKPLPSQSQTHQVVPPQYRPPSPPLPPLLRIFPGLPQGWIDGSKLT